MAAAAVLNAVWDLYAKREGVPLWQLLARMSPEQIVALVDFRYLTDALTPEEALALLREREPGRAERERALLADGLAAYTTSPGWLGYDDDKLRSLIAEALDEGFTHVKLKVGADVEDDARRCAIARDALGDAAQLSVDANQAWDVDDAIALHGAPRAVRDHLDRGADEPRRRARPRRDRARASRRSWSPPASTRRTA